jgi:hypothetical protein
MLIRGKIGYDDGKDRRELLDCHDYKAFRRYGPWLFITMRYRDGAICAPLLNGAKGNRAREYFVDRAVFYADRRWLMRQSRRKDRRNK